MRELPIAAARGAAAAAIGSLTWWLVGMGGAVFIVFSALFIRELVRRRGGDERHESRLIFWGGVVVPAVVVSVVLGATLATLRGLAETGDEDAIVVRVTGHQWWWEIHNPEHDITTANEIRIPADREIQLELTSEDVVHSFSVPALAGTGYRIGPVRHR